MKYRMVRENRPTLKNYGRWKAVAVHENEVGTARIVKEVCRRAGASRGTVIAVLTELAGVVADHLREGDSVRLDDVGLLKLEIESQKVDTEEEFRAEEHIRGVRLHVLPECMHGHPVLYQGIKYKRIATAGTEVSHRGTEAKEVHVRAMEKQSTSIPDIHAVERDAHAEAVGQLVGARDGFEHYKAFVEGGAESVVAFVHLAVLKLVAVEDCGPPGLAATLGNVLRTVGNFEVDLVLAGCLEGDVAAHHAFVVVVPERVAIFAPNVARVFGLEGCLHIPAGFLEHGTESHGQLGFGLGVGPGAFDKLVVALHLREFHVHAAGDGAVGLVFLDIHHVVGFFPSQFAHDQYWCGVLCAGVVDVTGHHVVFARFEGQLHGNLAVQRAFEHILGLVAILCPCQQGRQHCEQDSR